MVGTDITPKDSTLILCKNMVHPRHFTNVLIENVVVLVNFGTFWPITFYVNIKSENFVNESCLSRRVASFDIGIDRVICL